MSRRQRAESREHSRATVGFVPCVLFVAFVLSASAPAAPFKVTEGKDFITVYEGEKPVLRYVRGEILPNGIPEDRRRSTYIHPLYSLDGKPLTDDAPKDHHHHRGLSWMWPKVTFDHTTKDLWTLKGIRQHYDKHEEFAFPDGALVRVSNHWEEDSTKRRLLDEKVTFTIRPADATGRTIDIELQLSAIDTPVSLGVSARGYGGLNLRFAPRKDTVITTSKGVVAKEVDRMRLTWADLSARFGDSPGIDGVAILESRANPHFPIGWTLRPYGNLNPAFPSTTTGFTVEPGKPLTLRYRIYVHRGKANPALLHRMFDEYNRGDNTACTTPK